MTSTFTIGAEVDTPILVTTLSWTRTPKTVVHQVLGNVSAGDTVVTITGIAPRSGSFEVLFADGADADQFALYVLSPFTFTDSDSALTGLVARATGGVAVEQESTTKAAFTVTFDWTEL